MNRQPNPRNSNNLPFQNGTQGRRNPWEPLIICRSPAEVRVGGHLRYRTGDDSGEVATVAP
jgi:hypothetical protein